MQITFIGGGFMAEAIVRGILDKAIVKPENLIVSDISTERCSLLEQRYKVAVTSDNCSAAEKGEVIVLAIQPQSLAEVMKELKGHLKPEQLILSIVARADIATLNQGLNHKAIVRAMPNILAQIGEGITVWTATNEVSQQHKERVLSILNALGKEVFVAEERYIDMATALSGSGPAYIFTIIESLIDAGVYIGLPREVAEELVLQTILGATHLVEKTHTHPAELRNKVTSPGGTTAEGLLKLEEGGLRALLTKAIIASYEKAKTGI